MCEGPNELEIIRILLENDKLCFSSNDLLNLVPFHARQITKSTAVQTALHLYPHPVTVFRIGDKLSDKLKIPKEYEPQIVSVEKYCTKPELEMLLIISEDKVKEFEKVKSSISPKNFSKNHIGYNRLKYNNSTAFYREYYGTRVELLVDSIKTYQQIKRKHAKDEHYLAELLK